MKPSIRSMDQLKRAVIAFGLIGVVLTSAAGGGWPLLAYGHVADIPGTVLAWALIAAGGGLSTLLSLLGLAVLVLFGSRLRYSPHARDFTVWERELKQSHKHTTSQHGRSPGRRSGRNSGRRRNETPRTKRPSLPRHHGRAA